MVQALDAALTALDDARTHLDDALRTAEQDPRELERIEQRLFALRAAARKYAVPVDELNALAARHAADLGLIDAGTERLAALERAAHEAEARENGAHETKATGEGEAGGNEAEDTEPDAGAP